MASSVGEKRPIIISPVTIEELNRIIPRGADDVGVTSRSIELFTILGGIREMQGTESGFGFQCAICEKMAGTSNHLTSQPIEHFDPSVAETGSYDSLDAPRYCLRQAVRISRIARNNSELSILWRGNFLDHSWFVNDCCIAMVEEQLNDANKLTINIKHQAMTRENYLIGSERGSNNVRRRVDGVDDLFVGGGID